jgi:hypothetical protein
VNAANISPVVDMTTMLGFRRHSYQVQVQGQTNFTDLSSGPSILTGAFNNIWTLRLTRPLRFHFGNDPAKTQVWIEDNQASSQRDWTRPMILPKGPFKDYALIARFTDPYTRQPTTVIARLGRDVTVVAVHFVLSSQDLRELDRRTSPDLRRKNIEIVLETMIVNGHAGSPLVDAVYTW